MGARRRAATRPLKRKTPMTKSSAPWMYLFFEFEFSGKREGDTRYARALAVRDPPEVFWAAASASIMAARALAIVI